MLRQIDLSGKIILIPFCIQGVIKAARRRRRMRMFVYVEEPTTQPTQMPLECELE